MILVKDFLYNFFLVISSSSTERYLLLQASEEAKKLVDEERAFAKAEIENAKAAVQRVEEALQEHERMSRAAGKQVIYLKKNYAVILCFLKQT